MSYSMFSLDNLIYKAGFVSFDQSKKGECRGSNS